MQKLFRHHSLALAFDDLNCWRIELESYKERSPHNTYLPIVNPYDAEMFVYEPWRPKGYFQFEIIINALVSSFPFIWIPFSAGTVLGLKMEK